MNACSFISQQLDLVQEHIRTSPRQSSGTGLALQTLGHLCAYSQGVPQHTAMVPTVGYLSPGQLDLNPCVAWRSITIALASPGRNVHACARAAEAMKQVILLILRNGWSFVSLIHGILSYTA